jgi:hypothetical protein
MKGLDELGQMDWKKPSGRIFSGVKDEIRKDEKRKIIGRKPWNRI